VQDGVKKIEQLAKDLSLDMSLLLALPTALAKPLSIRGSFDNVVMSQIEAEFQRCLAKFIDELANAEPARKEHAAKVEAASNEHVHALVAEEKAKTAKEAARAAQNDAETELKALMKAQLKAASDMRTASTGVAAATDRLKEFNEGPLAAFKELIELTEIVPPAPSSEEQEFALAVDTTNAISA